MIGLPEQILFPWYFFNFHHVLVFNTLWSSKAEEVFADHVRINAWIAQAFDPGFFINIRIIVEISIMDGTLE